VLLAVLVRDTRASFVLCVAAASCIALGLLVFFLFTDPVNRQTAKWTVLPAHWEDLRRRWEYSHAVSAALSFVALCLLTLSLLVGR
jgi:hypothetical protein